MTRRWCMSNPGWSVFRVVDPEDQSRRLHYTLDEVAVDEWCSYDFTISPIIGTGDTMIYADNKGAARDCILCAYLILQRNYVVNLYFKDMIEEIFLEVK